MRELNVTSTYNASSRITVVQITVCKRNSIGILIPCEIYIGRAKWNKKYDDFNPAEGFRVAYERALAQIPKENIIEKCGGLKDGDWVRVQSKHNNYAVWGIVFNNNILYMTEGGNYDRVSDYVNGETEFDYIATIVRPVGSFPITIGNISNHLYERDCKEGRCKVYTAD